MLCNLFSRHIFVSVVMLSRNLIYVLCTVRLGIFIYFSACVFVNMG